jgi:sugar/nucleoside kinase (ribokinase family)
MAELKIKPAAEARWDCVSFGEVMLRFDPGFGRVRNVRSFTVWEGGGEYNVARAMRKCWGKRSAVVTALPKNDLGWLVEDFIMQGGVDMSHAIWRDFEIIFRMRDTSAENPGVAGSIPALSTDTDGQSDPGEHHGIARIAWFS